MNIRTKLTLRFILITTVIIALSSVLIYVLSADYRQSDFYERLSRKANNTAKLLIEVEEVDATLLRRIEQDNPVSLPNEKIIIYNFRDTALFATDDAEVIQVNKALLDEIRLEDEKRWRQGGYEVLGFLYKGEFDRFVVIAAATDIYGRKRLQNLVYILALVSAISILIVSASAWIYAGKALQPISRVVKEVDEISFASLNLRVDEGNGQDEIAQLARTFNNMLSRLETAFASQKNFISNASHELRTPLTAITGQLEVILLNPRSSEEYREVIDSVLDDIRHLNTLANQLLLLAQTSSEERQRRMRPLRVDELVWQAKDDLLRHHPGTSVEIDIDECMDDESKLTIIGDEQLMKTAMYNVMENACKYSRNRTCGVLIRESSSSIVLDFKDQGIGIPKEDVDKIFEPFYRGSNTKGIRGHGIGLSMVRGIVKLHQGTLKLTSEEGKGTVVSMAIPMKSL